MAFGLGAPVAGATARRSLANFARRPRRPRSSRGRPLRCASRPAPVSVSPPATSSSVRHLYRRVPPSPADCSVQPDIEREDCFNILLTAPLTGEQETVLLWLLAETFEPHKLTQVTTFSDDDHVVEVGPRLSFQTAWSANAVTICQACGLQSVARIERSRRYRVPASLPDPAPALHDRMTEQVYEAPLSSFDAGLPDPSPTRRIPVCSQGVDALREVNTAQGLGFDDADLEYYSALFRDRLKRDPTDVEIFDMAQSNSEHSRHWFFAGKLVIDGVPQQHSLFSLVKQTLKACPDSNSVIAFADNSSSIRGINPALSVLAPASPDSAGPSQISPTSVDYDVLFTAETHNFPSGVAPFPGAETGTGGRLRDTAATGIGSLVGVGTAGYSVGNLRIPGYRLPWEDESFLYPDNLAAPLKILIDASNGASDYGNKFGEPVINGFARSYGLRDGLGSRREYVKPIMFSGGMGMIRHSHSRKRDPEVGHWVVKVGGPAYRIGLGGGAASSMVQGDNRADLDFNAVQRGDAEMEQKVYRVLRACAEMGDRNPIVSIHDQGAGGNCNVVKELIYPSGALVNLREIWVADASMSALEIWGAEYQEQFGLILRPESVNLFKALCQRENVVPSFLGQIDGSGRITLWDQEQVMNVVDLDLNDVLGELPQKTFLDSRAADMPARLLESLSVSTTEALERVLRLMTVGSKRFLTTKVDRSVTGLVARQQCVGPLHLPLSDVAVMAQSHLDVTGAATSIGERPGLTAISPRAMARMTVGEMITNMAAAHVTRIEDIKCEGNWMWAAKLPGEGAAIYDAAEAMRDAMIALGIAIDGGKDSVSMAARCPEGAGEIEVVKAPGTLVISGYCTMADINAVATPDLKLPGRSSILHVDLASARRRLGGSALAQVFGEIGDQCPDLENPAMLKAAFSVVQSLICQRKVLSYHDISDGGIVCALLEMAFAGNCGLAAEFDCGRLGATPRQALFAEELGMLLEVHSDQVEEVMNEISSRGLICAPVAESVQGDSIRVADRRHGVLIQESMTELRQIWESTSFEIEKLQADPACVEQEFRALQARQGPIYRTSFTPLLTEKHLLGAPNKHKVAIVRQEGSNGDREMSAAFYLAGFEPWDICVNDIASGKITLDEFRGVAYVGGFSFADVLDSGKGWAAVMRFKGDVRREFEKFYSRVDTFSLGVCNGCQLMALLGLVPHGRLESGRSEEQPRFVHNKSGRFESRFTTVRVNSSPAIMLKDMEGSVLGVWSAHGEGRAYFPSEEVLEQVLSADLLPLQYVDEAGTPTEQYPFNPNGSTRGIAALCSPDGRHLAMMPHPERTVLQWQWPWVCPNMAGLPASPWLTMFQNARTWCDVSIGDS